MALKYYYWGTGMMDAWGKQRRKSSLCLLHEKDHAPQRQICLTCGATNRLQMVANFFLNLCWKKSVMEKELSPTMTILFVFK